MSECVKKNECVTDYEAIFPSPVPQASVFSQIRSLGYLHFKDLKIHKSAVSLRGPFLP